jgi:hypothetical protein
MKERKMPSCHVACNCWICKLGGYFTYEDNRKVTKFPIPIEPVEELPIYQCECGFKTYKKEVIQQHIKNHKKELDGCIKIIKESLF